MRWLRVAVVLAALGVVAHVADARVPAFVRQTGLTCNQCHMSVTPAPDFTFTGMKFRINGFRTPWVAEKVEAGTIALQVGKRAKGRGVRRPTASHPQRCAAPSRVDRAADCGADQ